jgi:hypothetical protein
VLGRALGALDRAVFEPTTLFPSVVTALAFAPPVIAGLVFFQVPALTGLGLALAMGAFLHVLAWRLKQPLKTTPVLASVLAVGLLGAGAPPAWMAGAALLGGGLDLLRQRFTPSMRVQAGLVAYAAIFLAGRGLVDSYLRPGSLAPLAEPIRLWAAFGGGGAAPIDPTRLYVGNVPGPLFATSLMAVVIGAAWFWYAGRLSPSVPIAFAAGAAIPAVLMHWNAGYHLDSGPAWFVVALVLADRDLLPASRAARPLLGFAAGVIGFALRTRGAGIEAVFVAVVALQLGVAAVQAVDWLVRNPAKVSRRLHVAQVRVTTRGRAA